MSLTILGEEPEWENNTSPVLAFREKFPKLTVMQRLIFEKMKEDPFNSIFLSSPTASGKTLAVSAPIFESGSPAVFVYPFRALVDDQHRQLIEYAQLFGISRDRFETVMGGTDTSTVLHALKDEKYILATPDKLISFFIGGRKEKVLLFSLFSKYKFVFDEIHVYDGMMFKSIVYFLRYASLISHPGNLGVYFLSATFSEGKKSALRAELKKIGQSVYEIPKDVCTSYTGDVHIEIKPPKESAGAIAKDIKENNTVCILNSARKAWLVSREIPKSLLYIGQDKMTQDMRTQQLKRFREEPSNHVLVSSPAIECGVDFLAKNGFFEECEPGPMLQRFGRFGRRGREAKVTIYSNRLKIENDELNRKEFEAEIQRQIPSMCEEIEDEFSALAAYPYFCYMEEKDLIEKEDLELCHKLEEKNISPPLFFREYIPPLQYESGEYISLRSVCKKNFSLIEVGGKVLIRGRPDPERYYKTPNRPQRVAVNFSDKGVVCVKERDDGILILGEGRFCIPPLNKKELVILEFFQDQDPFREDDNLLLSVNGKKWYHLRGRFYGPEL